MFLFSGRALLVALFRSRQIHGTRRCGGHVTEPKPFCYLFSCTCTVAAAYTCVQFAACHVRMLLPGYLVTKLLATNTQPTISNLLLAPLTRFTINSCYQLELALVIWRIELAGPAAGCSESNCSLSSTHYEVIAE